MDLPTPQTLHGTVVLTDDNRDAVDMLAILLRSEGYKVEPAYSAREALDALDQITDVCVVVSDIRMPDVDGFDFLRVIKQRFPSMPVVLMTGFPVTAIDVVPHGAKILQKPFNIEDLVRMLPAQPAS